MQALGKKGGRETTFNLQLRQGARSVEKVAESEGEIPNGKNHNDLERISLSGPWVVWGGWQGAGEKVTSKGGPRKGTEGGNSALVQSRTGGQLGNLIVIVYNFDGENKKEDAAVKRGTVCIRGKGADGQPS